jgi:hypothetical protein
VATACGAPPRDREPVTAAPLVHLELRSIVSQGDDVPIVLRVTNPSDRPLDVYFTGRTIAFDIIIAQVDGAPVWRRLQGAAIEQILQVRTIAPRQWVELRDTWKATVAPGRYAVRGVIPTDGPEPLQTPAVFLDVVP